MKQISVYAIPGLRYRGKIKPSLANSVNIETIASATTEICNISISDLRSESRISELMDARFAFAHLCYKYIKEPMPTVIGRFTNKSYSTIIHYKKRALDLIETDRNFERLVRKVESIL